MGPDGEAFFDFAIRDALAAGASDVVMIVRTDIEDDVRTHLARHHSDDLRIEFVRQDELGPPRAKPWGTAHAVLSARPAISQPFVVVNADDYYGQWSYARLAERLRDVTPGQALLAGFELGRTLPSHGTVSRGVCRVDDAGRLVSIVETHGIGRTADGGLEATDPAGAVDPASPVSMNMWAFAPEFLGQVESRFSSFLATHGDDPKAEYLLPGVVADLIGSGELSVDVVPIAEDWIGVTNPDDLEPARAVLAGRSS